MIASRADPPLPLASLRAAGELLEIRAADLRFTSDEAAAYLNDAMGLTLAPTDIDVLEDRTEGWIAALQLAALSMQGRDDVAGFIAGFAGDDRFILDYLVGEVLDRQSADVRRFLLETSHPEPAHRPALRRRHGPNRRQGHARATRTGQPVPRPARRPPHLVPLPPPLRRRAPGPPPGRGPRPASPSSTGGPATGTTRTVTGPRRSRHAMAGAALRTSRAAHRAGRPADAAEPPGGHAPSLARSLARRGLPRPARAHHRPWWARGWPPATPPGSSRCSSSWSSTLDRSAPPPIVFDHEAFDRLPAQLAVYRAGAGPPRRRHRRHDRPRHPRARSRRAHRPPPPRQRDRAAGARALGRSATSTRRSAATPKPSRASSPPTTSPTCSAAPSRLADIQIAQGRLGDATRTFEAGLRRTDGAPRAAGRRRHARRV